jgi:Fe-S-cluster containining protein
MIKVDCKICKKHCCGQIPGVTPVLLPEEVEKFKNNSENRDGIYTLQKKESTGTCVFLDDSDNHCTIYADRPFECKLFPYVLDFESKKQFKLDSRCSQKLRVIADELEVENFINNHEFPKEWIKKYIKLDDC